MRIGKKRCNVVGKEGNVHGYAACRLGLGGALT